MDTRKRDALLAKVGDLYVEENFDVWVGIEEFFDGNDDLSSFWCNLEGQPDAMTAIRDFLVSVRARSEVFDLRIGVTQFDGGEDEWPFSDRILLVTDASQTEVHNWFAQFLPDEIWAEEGEGVLSAIGRPGQSALTLWWD